MQRRLFILLTTLLCSSAFAQPFKASWITTDTAPKTALNSWHCFRKTVSVGRVPQQAIARIAVDSKYWLWINDRLVVYEGGLKRGPNPRDTYYDEVNLAPHLKAGPNTIAVLVWFWGGKGFSHHNSGRGGFFFDCQSDGLQLFSDASWKAKQHPAYEPSRLSKPNFRLSEPNIRFDARKDMPGWFMAAYKDTDWQHATVVGPASVVPWNQLVKRPIPMFRDYDRKPYVSQERRGDTLVCRLPYDGQFSPYLKVKGPAGQRIVIVSDTYYHGAGSPTDSMYTNGAEYITREGVQEYESLGWLSGHEIKYLIPKGVEVLDLQHHETSYGAAFAGTFQCNDPALNTLWEKARRSLFVNIRDNYMDCPDRERAQWPSDAAAEMAQAFYALDTNSFSLSRKLYRDLIGWQRADSVIYAPVPQTDWDKELPNQSLMTMSEVWRYFRYTHDTTTLRQVYPAMKKYLGLWRVRPSGQPDAGSINYRRGGWDWGDWGDNQDMVLIQHGWYVITLQTAVKIAQLLGFDQDVRTYQQQIAAISGYINSPACWNGQEYRHKDYKKITDDRANALMLAASVADSTKWQAMQRVFDKYQYASPWMEKVILECLIKMGQPQKALTRMKSRYKAMIDSPLTTLWEIWEYDPASGHGGYNHGWSGGALVLLSEYVAGLSPDDQRADTYRIFPTPAGLANVRSSMSTPHGVLGMQLATKAQNLTLSVNVPKGATALVGIPQSVSLLRQLTCNGKPLTAIKGARTVGQQGDRYVVEVPAGTYNFQAQLSKNNQ